MPQDTSKNRQIQTASQSLYDAYQFLTAFPAGAEPEIDALATKTWALYVEARKLMGDNLFKAVKNG